jgi:DNA-binding transcriptional regulator YiaG
MTIKEIRTQMGLSQSQFANYFEIPIRTIQKWECGQSSPPPYIPKMMLRIVKANREDLL